jgi:protoporphyrinogen oxidase
MIAVLGAGIAGLAAGYELMKNGVSGKDIIIFEKEDEIGGLAQTKRYDGFRFDLGPHRWFTRSKEVDHLWNELNSPEILDLERYTRIWYKNRLINYPLSPFNVIKNLGISRSGPALFSYVLQRIKDRFNNAGPQNMEEALIRQFGPALYKAFFKDYNQKLWGGEGCRELSPDWVGQRVKNLTLSHAVFNAIGLSKKGSVDSLTDRFKYPVNGCGQLSERLAKRIKDSGGTIVCNAEVRDITLSGKRLTHIVINRNGYEEGFEIDFCISSIPIDDLCRAVSPALPSSDILQAANGLRYRHMIFVALFIDAPRITKDQWVYVQDPAITFNRFMDMNSWNPSLSPTGMTSLVFEVTCDRRDARWSLSDSEWIKKISEEFVRGFNFIDKKKIVGGKVYRKTHAYPVYTLDYKDRLGVIRNALGNIENLQLIGRNGLFRYNNMDHSMATGLIAARNYSGKTHMDTFADVGNEFHG